MGRRRSDNSSLGEGHNGKEKVVEGEGLKANRGSWEENGYKEGSFRLIRAEG